MHYSQLILLHQISYKLFFFNFFKKKWTFFQLGKIQVAFQVAFQVEKKTSKNCFFFLLSK
jgi:hypothetical protein